ncbi:MAG: hypothetical protein OEW75_18515 [Cyclobacteriaceae bacterium]|nr:hypothetical protein [Cyclobacteriaceae bacterium]
MIKITPTNKEIAIKIAAEAFIDNPSMNWFLKNDDKKEQRMYSLCDYCVSVAMEKKGGFLSNDLNGITLIYKNDAKISFWEYVKLLFKLLNKASGWIKLPELLHRQHQVSKRRGDKLSLYVLLFASNRTNGNSTAYEMKDFIFEYSDKMKLPIYVETASRKTKVAYERYGFQTYDSWELTGTSTVLWFLKYENKNNGGGVSAPIDESASTKVHTVYEEFA